MNFRIRNQMLIVLSILMISLLSIPVNANAPMNLVTTTTPHSVSVTAPNPNPIPIQVSLLTMKLLSSSISNCSQIENINATWIGNSYYVISPSSFSLIIRTPNAIYGNNTDLSFANNLNQWYIFHNIPITISVSFEFCNQPQTETLIYSDGTFTFSLF